MTQRLELGWRFAQTFSSLPIAAFGGFLLWVFLLVALTLATRNPQLASEWAVAGGIYGFVGLWAAGTLLLLSSKMVSYSALRCASPKTRSGRWDRFDEHYSALRRWIRVQAQEPFLLRRLGEDSSPLPKDERPMDLFQATEAIRMHMYDEILAGSTSELDDYVKEVRQTVDSAESPVAARDFLFDRYERVPSWYRARVIAKGQRGFVRYVERHPHFTTMIVGIITVVTTAAVGLLLLLRG